mgnify:CR=1 FL=1
MELPIDTIATPDVRLFYALYWPQRSILRDFFSLLPEQHYDVRLVDTPTRHADTPRESLIHLIRIQQIYLAALLTRVLRFEPQQPAILSTTSKPELLRIWEQLEQAMFQTLTADTFNPTLLITVPWGESAPVDLLFFLRDHDILHIGWNLAVMDHLDLPRFASLNAYWGSGDADAL